MSQSPTIRVAVSSMMRAEHELEIASISLERVARVDHAEACHLIQRDIKELRRKVARIKAVAK